MIVLLVLQLLPPPHPLHTPTPGGGGVTGLGGGEQEGGRGEEVGKEAEEEEVATRPL